MVSLWALCDLGVDGRRALPVDTKERMVSFASSKFREFYRETSVALAAIQPINEVKSDYVIYMQAGVNGRSAAW